MTVPVPPLDPDSRIPLYRQLRNALERAITGGQYTDGHLPSSRSLAAELGVSRNTVSLAYQELVAEGFITSRPRSGLQVNPDLRRALAAPRLNGNAQHVAELDWDMLLPPLSEDGEWKDIPEDWHTYPYPFVYGQPSVEAFPSRAWVRCLREALHAEHIWHSLGDSRSRDDPLLVQQLCGQILPSRGILATPETVLITAGSQQGLYLVAKALLRDGVTAAVENPGYPDAHRIFRRAGARLAPVPVDREGVVVGPSFPDARLALVTPGHQFPTGVTLSGARRRALLDLAADRRMLLVEDDYDAELRYQSRPAPALKAADPGDRVIYLGSFSKFLAPGLRLGFMIGPPAFIERAREDRRMMTRHPPGHIQRALALLIASGDYRRTLRRYRGMLQTRWQMMIELSRTHLPWSMEPPAGGTNLWLTADPSLDAGQLVVAARAAGVLVEAGHNYFLGDDPPRNHVKLGFAAIRTSQVEKGIRTLAGVAQVAR